MYAVFRSGGKQYRASTGDRLRVERLEAEEGSEITFDEVLLVGEGADIKVGTPLLAGESVAAKVLVQGKSRKVNVVKFRRRQNYLRQGTHRQFFTEVEITAIGGVAAKPKPAADKSTANKPAADKSAASKPAADKSAADKPATKKTAVDKPATKKPAAKKAATKTAATKKPAAKKTAKKVAKKKAVKKTSS